MMGVRPRHVRTQLTIWYLAVFGFLVVALMIWLPGGLLSIPDRFARKRNIAALPSRATPSAATKKAA